jgi:hypothetical protein
MLLSPGYIRACQRRQHLAIKIQIGLPNMN